jgi:hypothetical protein
VAVGIYNGQREKVTSTGKSWRSVTINGESVSAWDKALFGTLDILLSGTQVEYETMANGKYLNLTAIRPVLAASSPHGNTAATVSAATTASPSSVTQRERGFDDVKRSMIISYAKDLMVGGKVTSLDDGITIIYGGIRFLDRLMAEEEVNPTVQVIPIPTK